MKLFRLALIVILISIFMGCGIPQLHYFQVNPYAKPFPSTIKTPLYIVLMEEVKDEWVVSTPGIRSMKVSDFRKSFGESLQNTMEKNFENIKIVDEKPSSGLSLVIYRLRPYWTINSRSTSSYEKDGSTHHSSSSLVSAAFQFESSLFLDQQLINTADLTVYSEDQMMNRSHAHPVFMSGMTKTCERINKEIFTPETIQKIREER